MPKGDHDDFSTDPQPGSVARGADAGACGGGGDAPTPAQRAESDLQAAILASGGAQRLRLPDDGDYAAIPQDPRNPITASKVALGKLLFHDTMLGTVPAMGDMRNTYSCASCHNARFGFQAGWPRA